MRLAYWAMTQPAPNIPTPAMTIARGVATPAPRPVAERPTISGSSVATENTGPMNPTDWARTPVMETRARPNCVFISMLLRGCDEPIGEGGEVTPEVLGRGHRGDVAVRPDECDRAAACLKPGAQVVVDVFDHQRVGGDAGRTAVSLARPGL